MPGGSRCWHSIRSLYVYTNKLNGSIPSAIGGMTALT
jgi:hypothetical protein